MHKKTAYRIVKIRWRFIPNNQPVRMKGSPDLIYYVNQRVMRDRGMSMSIPDERIAADTTTRL
jgi:hypothetical protein